MSENRYLTYKLQDKIFTENDLIAQAQELDMSLNEYKSFLFNAGMEKVDPLNDYKPFTQDDSQFDFTKLPNIASGESYDDYGNIVNTKGDIIRGLGDKSVEQVNLEKSLKSMPLINSDGDLIETEYDVDDLTTANIFVKNLAKKEITDKDLKLLSSPRMYEKYLLRKIVKETESIKFNSLDKGQDVYGLINQAYNLMGELIRVRPGETFSIDKTMRETISTMKTGNTKMIKTGYREIDGLAGGLTRGEITIVGGRPGHGKTTFLVNILSSLIKGGYKVAVFNRELPNSEVIKKLLCIENPNLKYRDVRRGIIDKTNIAFIDDLKNASKIVQEKYTEDKFIMFDSIRNLSKTASEVKKFKPDVIIDDYIQLVSPNTKNTERRLQLEALCNDYKWLAKETNCAVILASQLNRSLEARSRETKRPQLSDLAESGAIEQIAENVFFVFYSYKVDPAMHSKNEIKLIASKVRYGESAEINLHYNGDICTIYDNWSIPHAKEIYGKDLPF